MEIFIVIVIVMTFKQPDLLNILGRGQKYILSHVLFRMVKQHIFNQDHSWRFTDDDVTIYGLTPMTVTNTYVVCHAL